MTRWSWLGEHFALDVANTVRLRRGQYVDLLATPGDLLEWAGHQEQRVPAGLDGAAVTSELHRFAAIRDHVVVLLRAAAAGVELPVASVTAINAAAAAAPTVRLLEPSGGGRTELVGTADPIIDLIGLAAAATIDLLTGQDRDRLQLCPAPSCGQLYLQDRASQTWCSTACGNRARGARHHAARRAHDQATA